MSQFLVTPPARPPALPGQCVVFFHAHPDDEAIFTAATMHQLSTAGTRIVLVTATCGELGEPLVAPRRGETVAGQRRRELEQAAACLGVDRLVLLGRRDSGMPGWQDNAHPDALATAAPESLAHQLAELCAQEGAVGLVYYDSDGIYRHPDHLAVHRIGRRAAAMAGITGYEATVDREHPWVSGSHLVARAARSLPEPYGRLSAEIPLVVAAGPAGLAAKRAAMAAHASQIHPATLSDPDFTATYRLEWYLRTGPVSALDWLDTAPALTR